MGGKSEDGMWGVDGMGVTCNALQVRGRDG